MAVDPIALLQAQLTAMQAQQAFNDAQAAFLKLQNQSNQDVINNKIAVLTNPAPVQPVGP